MNDHLWNTRECAEHLQCDEREFRRLIQNGEIPSLSVAPNSTRFRPESVTEWERCRQEGKELDLTRVPVAIANDRLLTLPRCVYYLHCGNLRRKPAKLRAVNLRLKAAGSGSNISGQGGT